MPFKSLKMFTVCLRQTPVSILLLLTFQIVSTEASKKCDLCKDIVRGFDEGLKKTAKGNFGGGNTHWEEKSLGSFATSETRFVEIMEDICSSDKECHMMAEQHEELLEKYWFAIFAKKKGDDLHTWFCIENLRVCCPENTYGPNCKACPGGEKRPCSGNGNCGGHGTREGSGKCECNAGYQGDLCDECTDGYFEESKNDTHTVCKVCHASCKSTCSEWGPKGCDECKEGWTMTEEEGCEDVDECSAETFPCKDDEFCTNTQGSYTCGLCDAACDGCTHLGPDKCKECKEGYMFHIDESKCKDIDECEADKSLCTGEHQKCQNTPGNYKCVCDDGFIMEEDNCIPKPKEVPKPAKSSSQAKDKEKKKKKKEKPTLYILFAVILLFYLVGGKLLSGNVPVVSALTGCLACFVYWFALQFDKHR